MTSQKGFGKVETVAEVKKVKLTLKECEEVIAQMECALLMIEDRISKGKKFKRTRKEMVLEVLHERNLLSVKEIAERVSIMAGVVMSSKNISSLLTYLRDDLADEGKHEIVRVGRGHGKIKLIDV